MDILADASIASESAASASVYSDMPSTMSILNNKNNKRKPQIQNILMQLLNDESAPDAIWWLPGEKAFAINSDEFPAVLERYLPGTKYASFIRSLHKLGFSRQTRSLKKVYGTLPKHAVAFRHDKFRRDQPELLEELKNGYWKESKARSASGGASLVSASPGLPPASVEVPSPLTTFSLEPPETWSVPLEVQKPVAVQVPAQVQETAQANAHLLQCAEAFRQQREVEINERNIQMMILRQRVAQEQAEMQQLLALRQQQEQEQLQALWQHQQQEQIMAAALAAQQTAPAPPALSNDQLWRLQLLQQLQQQAQPQAPPAPAQPALFNPYLGGSNGLSGWY